MRHNTENNEIVHTPVMWQEVLEFARQSESIGKCPFVDCTLGEGGHSELLLKTFDDIKIIAFERDSEILEVAEKRLMAFKDRISFVNDNFSNLSKHLNSYRAGISCKAGASGFLYDFGISSYHFEKSGRGFSFNTDEPLDMRLDKNVKYNAAYIINKFPEKELEKIFLEYGEEHWAKKIAKEICAKRKQKEIATSAELAEIVKYSIPARFRVKNIHPATRVFQAVRIAVNDELSAIRSSLAEAAGLLSPGGVIMAISFHSLEDRIVKDQFRRLSKGCTCELQPQHCQCSGEPVIELLTKKPVLPKRDEIMTNRRSRSAKLRVCKKLSQITLM
jgi:16S rRNA (cytosine1402-N4)-methyltransferase